MRKQVVSFKVDELFLLEIDRFVAEYGFKNRSDFIREAIVFYMNWLRSGGKPSFELYDNTAYRRYSSSSSISSISSSA